MVAAAATDSAVRIKRMYRMTENMRDTQERLIGHPSASQSNQNVLVEVCSRRHL